MREIKFRAWHDRKMLDWEGLGNPYDSYEPESGSYFMILVNGRSSNIMQYTGLKDVDNVDIYDGDILEDFGRIPYKVQWKNGGFRCAENRAKMGKKKSHLHSKMIVAMQLKVIGNIHENPELL